MPLGIAKAGYQRPPHTFLFSETIAVGIKDTSKFGKPGPCAIGLFNVRLPRDWPVVGLRSLEKAAHDGSGEAAWIIIGEAGHDAARRSAGIQDLISRGVHRPIVSAGAAPALHSVVTLATNKGG